MRSVLDNVAATGTVNAHKTTVMTSGVHNNALYAATSRDSSKLWWEVTGFCFRAQVCTVSLAFRQLMEYHHVIEAENQSIVRIAASEGAPTKKVRPLSFDRPTAAMNSNEAVHGHHSDSLYIRVHSCSTALGEEDYTPQK
jgi:hypothetical protein